ncbi:MAG: hypothetical protein AAGG51_14645, partial [Cyanobacteria bacterium P01_G01_bin.54]
MNSREAAPTVPQPSTWRWGCRCNGKKRSQKFHCPSFLPPRPPELPDLAIYSQEEMLEQGRNPSWDSPDIITNNWRPFRLFEEA